MAVYIDIKKSSESASTVTYTYATVDRRQGEFEIDKASVLFAWLPAMKTNISIGEPHTKSQKTSTKGHYLIQPAGLRKARMLFHQGK